jgi:hypothetical protein
MSNNNLGNNDPNSNSEEKENTDQKSRKDSEDKKEIWVNSIKADGGAYKGCPKNDYCQHFVDSRERPQNFIRDYEEEKRFSGKNFNRKQTNKPYNYLFL